MLQLLQKVSPESEEKSRLCVVQNILDDAQALTGRQRYKIKVVEILDVLGNCI